MEFKVDYVHHDTTTSACDMPFPQIGAAKGWQCPICGRVYSPTTMMCFYCGNTSESHSTNTYTYTTAALDTNRKINKRDEKYESYTAATLTKEVLDSISVGDTVRINGSKRGMKCQGKTDNFIALANKSFQGKYYYSIIDTHGFAYDSSEQLRFICGTDNLIFGDPLFNYDFSDKEALREYLGRFESGETEVSGRNWVVIRELVIVRKANKP